MLPEEQTLLEHEEVSALAFVLLLLTMPETGAPRGCFDRSAMPDIRSPRPDAAVL
jgi:hypothetical protein